jgi:hypothetical protein
MQAGHLPVRVRTAAVGALALSVVVAGLAAASPWAAAQGVSSAAPGAARPDPAGILKGGQIRGMFLNDRGNMPQARAGDLPRLKAIGINTIPLFIFLESPSTHSNAVSKGAETTPDDVLRSMIRLAHGMGMAVNLVPYVRIVAPGPHQWRGYLDPPNPHLWFARYRAILRGYEQLAEETNVELFTLGTELHALQQDAHRADWKLVADEARQRFHGLLTYQSSSGKQAAEQMTWWNWVDIIGVSAYYSLSPKPNPPLADLENSWTHNYLPPLAALSKKFHRKVLFGEIGYSSNNYAAYKPAISWQMSTSTVSLQAQANAYEALLTTTERQSWYAGTMWFHWGPPRKVPNKTFEPRDKPAECVLAQHYVPNHPGVCALVQAGGRPNS